MPSELHSHYCFDDFRLDVANRQLWRNGEQVELNARYFDALVLLVQERGQLVEKDQFFSNVWDDVVVSDSALTQCIKDIRKQLGDDAGNPRYIKTVPGYGYRFIGSVKTKPVTEVEQKTEAEPASANSSDAKASQWGGKYWTNHSMLIGGAGTLGGIVAGLIGGLIYGFGLAYAPGNPEMGTASMLLVLLILNALIGGLGGLGVSFGMAIAITLKGYNKTWTIVGAAAGGLVVGGLAKLLGVDAFNLLFGTAPEGITGGLEGMVLGGAVALGAVLGGGFHASRSSRPVAAAASTGGLAGLLISLAGGRLMGGSLELLTRSFTGSRLRLDAFGQYFGETHFGYVTRAVSGGLEALLFGACVIGAILYLNRIWGSNQSESK